MYLVSPVVAGECCNAQNAWQLQGGRSTPTLWSLHAWLLQGSFPWRVRDTITESGAPSIRRLYDLKWGLFAKWCSENNVDPGSCPVSDVLRFLHCRLDNSGIPSILKVYVTAIAPFRSPGWRAIDRQACASGRFLNGCSPRALRRCHCGI